MIKKPSYIVLDVDGVMTSGKFLYSSKGKIFKEFGAHDNDGIKLVKKFFKIQFITADKRGYSISKKRIVDDMKQTLNLISERDRYDYLDKKFGLTLYRCTLQKNIRTCQLSYRRYSKRLAQKSISINCLYRLNIHKEKLKEEHGNVYRLKYQILL